MKSRIKLGLLNLMVLAVAAGCAPTNVQQQQHYIKVVQKSLEGLE